jgi:hypothetical protein
MARLKAINKGLSFLLEIAMLAAFGYWSFHAVENQWLRWVAAIGVPLVVFILWGLFLAPVAGRRTDSTLCVAASVVLFNLAALAFFSTNQPYLGATMLILTIINRTLVVIWKQW